MSIQGRGSSKKKKSLFYYNNLSSFSGGLPVAKSSLAKWFCAILQYPFILLKTLLEQCVIHSKLPQKAKFASPSFPGFISNHQQSPTPWPHVPEGTNKSVCIWPTDLQVRQTSDTEGLQFRAASKQKEKKLHYRVGSPSGVRLLNSSLALQAFSTFWPFFHLYSACEKQNL